MQQRDLVIIGGGPGGAAAAITAARAGLTVTLFEKGPHGRDKVCGDGLTPRAVAALEALQIDLSPAHRIDGLRMIAGKKTRELAWPQSTRFPGHGAVWPRHRFDTHLIDTALAAGVEVRFESEALPVLDGARVIGAETHGERVLAPLTILAAGAQGIKIMCSGRLGGNDIARREWYREGRVPLHTFRADIDFGFAEALCTYGKVGIKVWVFKGEILDVKAAVEGKDAVKSGKDAKEPTPEMVNLAKGGEEKKAK